MTEPFSKELMKKWDRENYKLKQYFHTDGTRKSFVFVKRWQIYYGSRVKEFEFGFDTEELIISEFDKLEWRLLKRKPTLTMHELSCVNETVKELGWQE